jgi:hypothetical protein
MAEFKGNVPRPKRRMSRKGFYSEPYLTCFFCNHLTFLDTFQFEYLQTIKAKSKVISGDFIPRKLQNKLPPCENCGRVDGFIVGAHDFTKDIEELKR